MAFSLDSGSKYSKNAYDKEIEKLKYLQAFQEKEAAFLTEEGKGVAEEGKIVFGDELDLEDLSEEERERRKSGRIMDTGLFI